MEKIKTLEDLKSLNPNYRTFSYKQLEESNLKTVLNYVEAIEQSRNPEKPVPKDLVIYTDEYGNYYPSAHIGKYNDDGSLTLVEIPFTPIVGNDDNRKLFYYFTGGGAWFSAVQSELSYFGKRNRYFECWGPDGIKPDGTLTFVAEVNVWVLNRRADEWKEYTKENYDSISVYQKENENGELQITKGSNFFYLKRKELNEYLSIFHAVEEPLPNPDSKKYWLFKYKTVNVYDSEKFKKIQGKPVMTLYNGPTPVPAVRVESGTTVIDYFDYEKITEIFRSNR